jgi:hypothetical protein
MSAAELAEEARLTTCARSLVCPMCWSRPGRPCTITGPAGDHLSRWLEAERQGLVTREQLVAVVAGLDVVAAHIIVRGAS